jgi:plasmid maintenance system killer protein
MKVLRTRKLDRLLRKLDPSLRRDVIATLDRFANDSANPGLNFEKLQGQHDLYSLRINRNFRIILQRTAEKDTFEVWRIGPHDIYRSLGGDDD